ncbi:hypothetical protein [Chitinivibrio alkaliphilus]|uniref:Anti-sigma-28 factor FlgM C-terminal domain-containing protein n=1 Tax=Chitinivibrio alkaliphilus ACht1 TaxID=1313304 RepID=U7D8S6_9BACT|nr:hypothetical protein [Chitinivibrio alkaliphilus]ERP31502.1 hypothetical protein CALK_1546 [Chitinivibrio alkaliphilus ACht1]
MSNINPRTGKRKGRFLWKGDPHDRAREIEEIRRRVSSGYYSSNKVMNGLVEDLAPQMSDSIGMEMYG